MAKDQIDGNGWNQHKIDVLNRLDRMEGLLKEMQIDNKDSNRKISKMCTELAVIKAKAGAFAAVAAFLLSGAWHFGAKFFN